MRKAFYLILVIRPHNVAAAVISAGVGYSLAGSGDWPWILLAAVALTAAAGNTINDLYDFRIDRINKPGRPLPSGKLNPRTVIVLYAVLLVATALLVRYLTVIQAVWIVVWTVLLHLYSAVFKRLYLVGNLLVASVSASGFLLGSITGGDVSAGAIPACFTFLFVMGRELVKDTDDIDGDRIFKARTVPIVSGRKAALAASALIFAFLILCFPIPYLLDLYGKSYGIIMMVSVVPILFVSFVLSLKRRSLGLISTLLKVGMFFGMMAFYLGRTG